MFQNKFMKTQNIFIFFILLSTISLLTACNKKTTPISDNNMLTKSDISKVDSATQDDGKDLINMDFIIIDGKQIKTGQTFFIKSTFNPEPYELVLDKIKEDGSIEFSYSENYLGEPCSNSSKTSSFNVTSDEKCLSSTTCDAGEKICFNVNIKNKNIILEYKISKWDYGI